ncbi:hypothetical protein FPV67DRAFT_838130 [Lyophyllum atratum]|nr:hypothetical protein FPV67DRAFT_838130 [Lyophyllum atratum]
MTPDEENLLRDIGVLLLGNLAGFTAMTLLYGVFVLLFSISTYKITHRGLKTRAAIIMFCTTLVTFLLATIYWSAYLASFATQVRGILVDTDIGPLDTGSFEGIDKKSLPFTNLENWSAQLLPMISDAVVVWRAWMFYDEQRFAMIAPIALLVGTVGSGLGFLGFSSSESANIIGGIAVNASMTRQNTFLSFSALSLATNVVSTVLIIYKIWSRGEPAGTIGIGQKGLKPSLFQSYVILLVETGILYAATQVINLVLELVRATPNSSLYFGERVITSVYTLCTAMYPTIVVILVITQRSVANVYGFIQHVPKKANVDIRSPNWGTYGDGRTSLVRPRSRHAGLCWHGYVQRWFTHRFHYT